MPALTRRTLLARAAAAGAFACAPREPGPGGHTRTDGTDPATDTGSVPTTPTTPGSRPNIVFIYLDQLRGDAIGAAGNPAAVTPNIDALAAESVLFSRCFTNGPVCVPARAAMLSGRYPFQTGIEHNSTVPTTELPSHPRRLRDEAGYQTMLIGKFHLHPNGGHSDQYKPVLNAFGFEDSVELYGQTDSSRYPSPYSDYLTATTPTGEQDKWERYIDYTDHYDWFSPPPDAEPWRLTTEDHLDQFCARTAAEWIRNRDDARPFYLQVNFPGPHQPFNGTSEFRALFDLATTPFPPAILVMPEKPSPLVEQYLSLKYQPWTPESQRQLALDYYATVALVDDAVGQVLAALTETGRLNDTWILFGGDHGEMLADHFITGKVVFYTGATHVPLMVRPPGGVAGWASAALVGSVDVTSTILEIAGLANEEGQPGLSLLPKVTAGPTAPAAHTHRAEVLGGDIGYYYLRDDDYRASYDPKLGRVDELYDLRADPDERNNLASDPAFAAVTAAFLARFTAYWDAWPIHEVVLGEGTDTGAP